VDRLCTTFAVRSDPDRFASRVRLRTHLDTLLYKVHTSRDLALMLAGTKPLAAFVGLHPPSRTTLKFPRPHSSLM
jgi:hypothetical protein